MYPSAISGFSCLSQELVDEIIDYSFILGDRDRIKRMKQRIAIKAFSLICRAFRHRAQQLLFSTLSFVMEEEFLGKFKRLNDVFSMNPRLASHVRVLELRIRGCSGLRDLFFEDRNLLECIGHISRNGFGHQPLHLEVYTYTHREQYPIYQGPSITRSRSFEAHFVPFIASRLTSMDICGLSEVPVALFDASHNLFKLHMKGITLAPFEDSKRGPIERRPLIRELWVKESEDVVCNNCLRFDRLSKVTFCNYDEMTVQHVLLSHPPLSLEYLEFDEEDNDFVDLDIYSSKYSEMGVNLSTLPNLREILIIVTFPEHDIDLSQTGMDVVTDLVDFLHTLPANHQLKRLGLNFDISLTLTNLDEAPRAKEAVLSHGNWAALDSVLMSKINSITHVFGVEVYVGFWLYVESESRVPLDPIALQEAKNKDHLYDWGQKYLPRISASNSPNLDLEIAIHHDYVLN